MDSRTLECCRPMLCPNSWTATQSKLMPSLVPVVNLSSSSKCASPDKPGTDWNRINVCEISDLWKHLLMKDKRWEKLWNCEKYGKEAKDETAFYFMSLLVYVTALVIVAVAICDCGYCCCWYYCCTFVTSPTSVIMWIVRMCERSSRTVKLIRISMVTSYKSDQDIDVIIRDSRIILFSYGQSAGIGPFLYHFTKNVLLRSYWQITRMRNKAKGQILQR